MKKIIYFTTLSVLTSLGFMSCSKPGCTDQLATNYSADAKEDDGSCTYRGDVSFWCLPAVSDSLKDIEGHTMLRFELEGDIRDSIATEFFFAPGGACNTPGVMTIPMEGMTYEWRHYKYRVRGTDFTTIYEGFITLNANQCLEVNLD